MVALTSISNSIKKATFTATQAKSDGSTDISKAQYFLKFKEVAITEGRFHLPYTIVN